MVSDDVMCGMVDLMNSQFMLMGTTTRIEVKIETDDTYGEQIYVNIYHKINGDRKHEKTLVKMNDRFKVFGYLKGISDYNFWIKDVEQIS